MRKTMLLAMSIAIAACPVRGQIRTWEHSLKTHVGTSNLYAGIAALALNGLGIANEVENDEAKWWSYIPMYDWMIAVPSTSSPAGMPRMRARAHYYDLPWKNGWTSPVGDSYVGLEYIMTNVMHPWGLVFDIDYKNKGCRIGEDSHAAHILAPSAAIQIRFGDFKAKVRPVVQIGGGYDFVLGYKGDGTYSHNAFHSGFSGKASIGVSIPAIYSTVTIQYQRDFYEFFDQKYSPDGQSRPFEGYKRHNAYIMLRLSQRLRL